MVNVISMLQIFVDKKVELISLKIAGARHGREITQPNPKVAKAFDEQIMDVICGKQKNRCKQTTMALLWPSHKIFIEMAGPYQMVVTANRQTARHESIPSMFSEVRRNRK